MPVAPRLTQRIAPGFGAGLVERAAGIGAGSGGVLGAVRGSWRRSSGGIHRDTYAKLSDVQTGFRLYTRRLVEATGFPEARFDAESAVVVRACRRGFRIATVPVRLGFADGRTTSHYRPLVDSLRIARSVMRARLDAGAAPGAAGGPK